MELLKQLYEIHSLSGCEQAMTAFISEYVKKYIPEAVVVHEQPGNLYITKGESDTYPCIAAHTDQVQRFHPKDFRVMGQTDGVLYGYSEQYRRQCGLGADDKNGIWIALTCLRMEPVLKVALFCAEEIGCQGSLFADMDFFADCRFVLQADRMGCGDFITQIGDVELCTPEFVAACGIGRFGYEETIGAMTDVLQLRENGLRVCCANLSCGYYNPHTDNEFTVVGDLLRCLRMVLHIIRTCTDVYPVPEYTYSPDEWHGEENDYNWFTDLKTVRQ